MKIKNAIRCFLPKAQQNDIFINNSSFVCKMKKILTLNFEIFNVTSKMYAHRRN